MYNVSLPLYWQVSNKTVFKNAKNICFNCHNSFHEKWARYYNDIIIRPSTYYFQELPFISGFAIQKIGFNNTKKMETCCEY